MSLYPLYGLTPLSPPYYLRLIATHVFCHCLIRREILTLIHNLCLLERSQKCDLGWELVHSSWLLCIDMQPFEQAWEHLNWPRKKGDRVKTMRRPYHHFWVDSGWSRWSWACLKGHGCTKKECGRVERRLIEYQMVKRDVMECGEVW